MNPQTQSRPIFFAVRESMQLEKVVYSPFLVWQAQRSSSKISVLGQRATFAGVGLWICQSCTWYETSDRRTERESGQSRALIGSPLQGCGRPAVYRLFSHFLPQIGLIHPVRTCEREREGLLHCTHMTGKERGIDERNPELVSPP